MAHPAIAELAALAGDAAGVCWRQAGVLGRTEGATPRGVLRFVRDPRRRFVPVQRRLAEHDVLPAHAVHTASAVFAVPPPGFSAGFGGP